MHDRRPQSIKVSQHFSGDDDLPQLDQHEVMLLPTWQEDWAREDVTVTFNETSRMPWDDFGSSSIAPEYAFDHFSANLLRDHQFDPKGFIVARCSRLTREKVGTEEWKPRRVHATAGHICALRGESQKVGHIISFEVRDDFRRWGIGTQLFDRAETYLRTAGCQSVIIADEDRLALVPGVDCSRHPQAAALLTSRGYAARKELLLLDYSLHINPVDVVDTVSCRFSLRSTYELLEFARRHCPIQVALLQRTILTCTNQGLLNRILVSRRDREIVGFLLLDGSKIDYLSVVSGEEFAEISQELVRAALLVQQRDGLKNSWVRGVTPTIAQSVFEPIGFHEVRRFTIYEKSLST